MSTLPYTIETRKELDSRLGIKSSLSNLSSVVALSYGLYCANSKKPSVEYSDEYEEDGKKHIALKPYLNQLVSERYSVHAEILNNNPLLQSQLEALQVGLSLIFKIGTIKYVDFPDSDTKERTGGERFNKVISFSMNMKVLDLYISSWSEDIQRRELSLWLQNSPSDSIFSIGLKQLLTIFSEDTLYKIRSLDQEVVFQQEGIYNRILQGNTVIAKDSIEDVGPFRVFKSLVREGLHPYLQLKSNEFLLKQNSDLQDYNDLVQIGLSLNPKSVAIVNEVCKCTKNQPTASLQVIYYGAPGTGKSYKIKNLEKGQGTKPVRTTFHPDSDYATFVGAYKPTMTDNNDGRPNRSYSIDELAELLKVAYQSSERKTVAVDSFVLTYAEQINGIYGKISIKDLVEKSGLPDGYQATINDALNLYHYYIKQQSKDTKIAYKYIPQAFLKAYEQAWANYPEPQYLVIEEINRGNCAQIFGDLFQLLDRSAAGFSEYPIAADSDISKYLSETFATDDKFAPDESARAEINELYKEEYSDAMADVRSGELLLLPKNLHILATMNTSDQSLFPIDSAFKRRWDWEYIPIRNANKGWVITASGMEWDWWAFLQCINEKIGSVTDSEDKKLGYFFVKPQDNHTISAETFVSKVIFYLWNDVFKDYGFSDKEFQTANGAEMTFPMFYETNVEGQQVNEELVAQFLQNVVGDPLQGNNIEQTTEEITGA